MRLTLRTMLAYMDNILDPEDANELRRRIENSEFAGTLMRRIESAVRRIRLESPPVDAKGMGADANTVAEYLDNTLPPERVPDFERVCLESDLHLAEVAACHQVLAQVLGKRVELPTELRRRVYSLGSASTPTAIPSTPGERAPTVPAAAGLTGHEAGGRVWRTDPSPADAPVQPARRPLTAWLIAGLAVVMLVAAGVLVFGPSVLRRGAQPHELANTDSTSNPSPDPATGGVLVPAASDISSNAGPASDLEPGTAVQSASANPPSPAASDGAGESDSGSPPNNDAPQTSAMAEPPDQNPENDSLPSVTTGGSPGEGSPPLAQPSSTADPGGLVAPADEPSQPSTTPSSSHEGSAGVASGFPPDVDPLPDLEPLPDSPHAATDGGGGGTAGNSATAVDSSQPPNDPTTATGPSVDSFLPSSNQLDVELLTPNVPLLYRDSNQQWKVSTDSDALEASGALLSLPAFRPQLMIGDALRVTAIDARWKPTAAQQRPAGPILAADHGRFLVENGSPTPARLELHWGQRVALLRLSANGGAAAVEVSRLRLPGDDPQTTEAHQLVTLYVLSGVVRWEEPEGEQHDLTSESAVWALDARPAAPLERPKVPEWVDAQATKPILRSEAAPVVAEALPADEPPVESLEKLLDHRRVEVRALAALALGELGQYGGLLQALADPQQHWAWPDVFESLQEGLAQGSTEAEKIAAACQRIYPADGQLVYKFLVGFDPSELRTGGAEQLVQTLASAELPLRVLAIENLQRITGGKTLGYRADASERQRERTIVAWSRRLGRGEVLYQPHQLPEPMQWLERAGLLQL